MLKGVGEKTQNLSSAAKVVGRAREWYDGIAQRT